MIAMATAPLAGQEEVELPFLLQLGSGNVGVRYSPGYLDRAARVSDRYALLLDHLGPQSERPLALVIDLLTRREWEEAGIRTPYGLPAILGRREIALAAGGDGGTIALWNRLAPGGVPELAGHPIRGTVEEAESLAALDLIAQVEVVRLLLPDIVDVPSRPRWLSALTAHTLAWSAFARFESARLDEIGRFFSAVEGASGSSETELAPRMRDDARFFEAAALVGAREKKPPAKPFLKCLRKKRGEPVAGLVKRYPALEGWMTAQGSALAGS